MSESDAPLDDDPTPEGMKPASSVRRSTRKAAPQRGILAVGFVLNGIYEVKRFLARGGMGEVYEGVNVNADERVAIKVILPHLAADPKVQALFRKEAKTLTSFAHPALVQYRVLAREPRKDLLYIVTDFIDGEPLTSLLGRGKPTTAELVMLARRLAQGLAAAHSHGAIHRDISPDNVLLPGGVLNQAKIIDFGIAKSMEIGAQTVVGDGFAGKLGFVAPEQFGDFDRRIGPWTDVYSLALVVLALAGGSAPDMGTTLVQAIDRRRAGPVLAALPEQLRPLFARMLAPDPAARPQSMTEVIDALDALDVPDEPPSVLTRRSPVSGDDTRHLEDDGAGRTIVRPASAGSWGPAPISPAPGPSSSWDALPPPAEPFDSPASADVANSRLKTLFTPKTRSEPVAAPPSVDAGIHQATPAKPSQPALPVQPSDGDAPPERRSPWKAVAAAAVGVLALVGVGVALLPKTKPVGVSPPPSASAGAPAARVQTAIETTFRAAGCSWLAVEPGGAGADGATVIRVAGAAADPVAVNKAVASAVQNAGAASVQIDTAGVLSAPPAICPVLDTARANAAPGPAGLIVPQPQFEIDRGIQGCPAGLWAQSVVTVSPVPGKSLALVAIDPSGRLQQLAADREQLVGLAQRSPDRVKDLGGGRYRVLMCHGQPGLTGMLLIQGAGPFDLGLKSGTAPRAAPDFADRLAEGAKQHGWTMQLAWFTVVNNQTDRPDAPAAVALAPPTRGPGVAPSAVPEPLAPDPSVTAAAPSPASPAPVSAPSAGAPPTTQTADRTAKPAADWAPCRRYANGAWEELGYASQAVCVQRIFAGRCEVQTGQSGEVALRRYNGFLQAKSGRLFTNWRNVAPAEQCTN